jgi:hypothetical protein
MLEIWAIKRLGQTFGWFLQLGAADAKQMRDELQDLLDHCSQSIKALAELVESLYEIRSDAFSEDTFRPIFLHCVQNFTSPEAARRARSHCTDIDRDVSRIQFKAVKILRSDNLQWKNIDSQFAIVHDADGDFLDLFERDMRLVNSELQEILNLVQTDRGQAWQKYDQLRAALLADLAALRTEFDKMRQAEDHIRRLLT